MVECLRRSNASNVSEGRISEKYRDAIYLQFYFSYFIRHFVFGLVRFGFSQETPKISFVWFKNWSNCELF